METLFERLRHWRRERSLALDLPPYFILSFAHIAEIAARQPTQLEELATCPGMGPKKLAQFGAELLAIVQQARTEGLEAGVTPAVAEPAAVPLTEADLAIIAAELRTEVAQRLSKRLKGRFTVGQIEEALLRGRLPASPPPYDVPLAHPV